MWAIVNNAKVQPGARLRWGIFSNDFWCTGMVGNTSHKLPAALRGPLQSVDALRRPLPRAYSQPPLWVGEIVELFLPPPAILLLMFSARLGFWD